jgi:hypothetical protein
MLLSREKALFAGYGKGNHPLNVLFSVIGDVLFANFKNLLFSYR